MVTSQLFMLSSLRHVVNGRHGVKNFTLVRIRLLPPPVRKCTTARLSWWFQQIENKVMFCLQLYLNQGQAGSGRGCNLHS